MQALKKSISSATMIFLIFLFIFSLKFSFLPIFSSRLIALLGWISFGYRALMQKAKTSFFQSKEFIAYYTFVSFLAFQLFFFDFTNHLLLVPIWGVLLVFVQGMVGSAFLSFLLLRQNKSFFDLVFFIQCAIFVQGVFIIATYVSPSLREFILELLPTGGQIDFTSQFIRSRGLTHSGGSSLSVIQSIGLLFSCYILNKKRSDLLKLYIFLSIAIIFISIFLSGRTGLLVIPFIVLYITTYILLNAKIPKSIFLLMLGIPMFLFFAWQGLVFFYNYLGGWEMPSGESGLERTIRWATSAFFTKSGELRFRAVEVLLTHWHFPSGILDFVFGDPGTWAAYRIRSDIGLVRRLYSHGLIGSLLGYSFIYIFFKKTLSFFNFKSHEYLLVKTLMLWLFFIELKEPILLRVEILALVFLIYFFLRFTSACLGSPKESLKCLNPKYSS